MDNSRQITITNIPEISAIYFALLQCGYDFYTIERSREHKNRILSFVGMNDVPTFFSGTRQDTCEVYPYWPRAAILETATFHLLPDHSQFRDYDVFRSRIMSAGNITDRERDQRLWDWIHDFPAAISRVLSSGSFCRYLEWENKWIAELNALHKAKLHLIQSCLNICISKYDSPVQDIRIVINPVKCVYSADYYLEKNCFLFCSGAFRADSVIHEFLHHVVHPAVVTVADIVLEKERIYPGIDASYYLSGDKDGQLNAFEEYAVRELTENMLLGDFPDDIAVFLRHVVENNSAACMDSACGFT